jgi:hypothetical protein
VTVTPPSAFITWIQVSGRPVTFSNTGVIDPFIFGLTDNQTNTDEIVLRVSSGSASALVPVYTRPTDFVNTKYSLAVPSSDYTDVQNVNIELLFTFAPTVASSIVDGDIQLIATSFTFNPPSYQYAIDYYELLINVTGDYLAVQSTPATLRAFTVSTLPAHYKIRAYYTSSGVTYYKDSVIRYLTNSLIGDSYLGGDFVATKCSLSTSQSFAQIAYVYSRALVVLSEEDSITNVYSQSNSENYTAVGYVYYSDVKVLDSTYDIQLVQAIASQYAQISTVGKIVVAYQYNRGGLIIG